MRTNTPHTAGLCAKVFLGVGELLLHDLEDNAAVTGSVQAHTGLVNSLDCCGGQASSCFSLSIESSATAHHRPVAWLSSWPGQQPALLCSPGKLLLQHEYRSLCRSLFKACCLAAQPGSQAHGHAAELLSFTRLAACSDGLAAG